MIVDQLIFFEFDEEGTLCELVQSSPLFTRLKATAKFPTRNGDGLNTDLTIAFDCNKNNEVFIRKLELK